MESNDLVGNELLAVWTKQIIATIQDAMIRMIDIVGTRGSISFDHAVRCHAEKHFIFLTC